MGTLPRKGTKKNTQEANLKISRGEDAVECGAPKGNVTGLQQGGWEVNIHTVCSSIPRTGAVPSAQTPTPYDHPRRSPSLHAYS